MGVDKTYNDLKSPTAGKLGIWEQYDRALEVLACRCLGEPYNFYRIDGDIHPEMLGSTFAGKVVAACQSGFRQERRYNAHTVAASVQAKTETLTGMAQQDAEIPLPEAFDFFRLIYGQFVEVQIADYVSGWIMQGKTSEEIQVLAANYRREKGATARATGSDGVAEFEARLLAALDGKVYEYPVKPHLESMRRVIPDYAPGTYVVVAALSGIGKSYYGLNTIMHNALQGVPSCYINLEMSPDMVLERAWQMTAGEFFRRDLRSNDSVNVERVRAWERVKKTGLKSHNPGRSLPNILSTIRNEWNERGIQFALIDYAQLVSVPGFRNGRNYELGEVSAEFRALALDLKIPVMVLTQLKQEVVKYATRRGGLYDIKDCANFAQDAEFVHILHRPNALLLEGEISEYNDNDADVTNVKGRNTGTGQAKCFFSPVFGFTDNDMTQTQFPGQPTGALPAYDPSAGIKPNKNEDVPF